MKPIYIEIDSSLLENFIAIVLREGSDTTIYTNPFLLMKALKLEMVKALTDEVVALFQEMKNGGEPGIIHLHGLPQDRYLPHGESALIRSQNKTRVSEAVILAMAALLGCYLFSHPTEQDGIIVHNISPVKGKENIVSSVGRDPFYYHTEIAYSREVPKFLMLFCLESDPKAKTSYFPINEILEGIPDEIKETMRKPVFNISAVSGYDIEETVSPLLSVNPETGIETLRFYQHVPRIEAAPRSEEERDEVISCLAFLTSYAERVFPQAGDEPSIGLQPGEALLFNNGWSYDGRHHGVMHGRVGYIENPNRWLQRGYFFHETPAIHEEINAGYLAFLLGALTQKDMPFKLAVACLKTAIKNTADYRQAAEAHPDSTPSQLFFRGVNPRRGEARKNSWLTRIANNADVSEPHFPAESRHISRKGS